MWARHCTEDDPCLIQYTVDGAPFFRWSKHIGPDSVSSMVPVEDYVYESKWHMTDKLVEILSFGGWAGKPMANVALTPEMAPVPVPWGVVLYGTSIVLTVLLLMIMKGGRR